MATDLNQWVHAHLARADVAGAVVRALERRLPAGKPPSVGGAVRAISSRVAALSVLQEGEALEELADALWHGVAEVRKQQQAQHERERHRREQEQKAKAQSPMETRLCGQATETREARPRNALSGRCVMPSGRTACPSVTTTCQPPTSKVLEPGGGAVSLSVIVSMAREKMAIFRCSPHP